jgi:hypothetical protein
LVNEQLSLKQPKCDSCCDQVDASITVRLIVSLLSGSQRPPHADLSAANAALIHLKNDGTLANQLSVPFASFQPACITWAKARVTVPMLPLLMAATQIRPESTP